MIGCCACCEVIHGSEELPQRVEPLVFNWFNSGPKGDKMETLTIVLNELLARNLSVRIRIHNFVHYLGDSRLIVVQTIKGKFHLCLCAFDSSLQHLLCALGEEQLGTTISFEMFHQGCSHPLFSWHNIKVADTAPEIACHHFVF